MELDKYLLDNFTLKMDNETIPDMLALFVKLSQDKIELDKKLYFNYYPQEKHGLQLIVECNKTKENLYNLSGLNFHHASPNVWKMKVCGNLSYDENTYMVNSLDDNGCYCIRLVNKDVLGDIEEDTVVEAQVAGMALTVDIFATRKEYEDSVKPSKDGNKYFLEDGRPVMDCLIVNNSINKTEEERNNIDHTLDNTMMITGVVKKVGKYDLKMYDIDMNSYYSVLIDTKFGELYIFFSDSMLDENIKGFGTGMIISARILLSGDVAINEYDKYIKENKTVNTN